MSASCPASRQVPVSIRLRLARALLQVSLLWAVAVAGAVALVAHREVDRLLDGALQESAEILHGLLTLNASQLPADVAGKALPAPQHHERLVWQLVDMHNHVVLRSHRAPAEPLLPLQAHGLADAPDGARVFGMAFMPTRATLYVAQTASERTEASSGASLAVAGAALAVALVCGLLMRRRLRTEMLPLRELSDAVQSFHPLDPGATLPPATRSELVPIRDAIVDLGQRLALRVDNERAITAHAAHALRTPLAGMTAQLAVAMRECPPDLQPRLLRVRQASERLGRVVKALLTLFRSGLEPQLQQVDLVALVRAVPVDDLRVEVQATSFMACVDPDLLTAALFNLLDNSLRCGASTVRVSFGLKDNNVLMHVHDDGPGVSFEQLARMQHGLASQSYEQAMGLGLMLTDLVLRAHQGNLNLLDTAHGFGLVLSWPVTSANDLDDQAVDAPPADFDSQ
jgi:signal transduction histidine kinase